MDIHDNIVQASYFEVFRRVLVPVNDDIADPGVDFARCVQQCMDKIANTIAGMPALAQQEYFMLKSKEAVEWCEKNNAPADMKQKIKAWATQQLN